MRSFQQSLCADQHCQSLDKTRKEPLVIIPFRQPLTFSVLHINRTQGAPPVCECSPMYALKKLLCNWICTQARRSGTVDFLQLTFRLLTQPKTHRAESDIYEPKSKATFLAQIRPEKEPAAVRVQTSALSSELKSQLAQLITQTPPTRHSPVPSACFLRSPNVGKRAKKQEPVHLSPDGGRKFWRRIKVTHCSGCEKQTDGTSPDAQRWFSV